MTPSKIFELIDQGALFVVNHSAGKDSQAMMIALRMIVPVKQLLVIHADLGRVEWKGNVEHIVATMGCDAPLVVARNERKDFLQMVEQRGMWPSPSTRQCTSDLKRDPISREIRRYLAAHPEHQGRVVSCMGIRAAESAARSKKTPFKQNKRESVAGREWYEWYPIFELSTEQVFSAIERAGQQPHWAYKAGMTRLSCSFCIMASEADLKTAASLRPDLYREYVLLERKIGHTMSMSRRPLDEIVGIPV